MTVVQGSAVMPLSLEETWEVFNGNELQQLIELSDSLIEVRDYRMREEGTPEYVSVVQAGPRKFSFRSDYSVYEPPQRSVHRVLDNPLGGLFYSDYESVGGGTRVTHRWEVEPPSFMRPLFSRVRKSMAKKLQADLDLVAERLRARSESSD